MLNFSADPELAEKQMRAIIFYLTTFGYIDGEFDAAEKSFVRSYIERLVDHRVKTGAANLAPAVQRELTTKFTAHFHEVFEGIDTEVKELFTEAVARDEDHDKFVHGKLKLRCFEIFQGFDTQSQEALMETIDHLIMADGEAHPAEVKFRAELSALLEAELDVELVEEQKRRSVSIVPSTVLDSEHKVHPFFDQFEHHYSRDPETMKRQIEADRDVVDRAIAQLQADRDKGAGKLNGKQSVAELADEGPFLDGHVLVCPTPEDKRFELTVLGDLHGCYSCLKAAIMQSKFFDKVSAFKADPVNNPEPKLVLLGDYIDRGIFSLNGVLRSVLLLYLTAPEHVVVLRGNHEYFVEFKGNVYGGVKPSEAIDTLKPHVDIDIFREYMRLFDALPSSYLFGKTLFVHGGIPRDHLFKERYKDLSSLNDPDIRFQMMWSDPSSADVIPAELQDQSARFAFGRLQAQRFLQRIGCEALIRGHEKVNEGFARVYDESNFLLCTLFSSGGKDNDDLPLNSSYRQVTPMALTMTYERGVTRIAPWEIDYKSYNDPERNGFFQRPPELRFGG
ncbi:MAG: metallophosphoesterase family protein [Myxococcales bacterium]